ncbi:peptidoglycan-binding protein [Microvirga sesbaniae]|uniref:peptidoglycan-binding protein n=1 Tax=Microvirga sesbaniae TaxID=681392 RepID=UPI0021C86714|nr:peptidoglycan-binding protein [Microvirga sp. HBU67692]
MKKLRGVVGISLLLAACPSSKGAEIKVFPEKDITIVSVEGELNLRDEDAFTDKVLRLKDAVVMFDSIGGNLIAGIEIGKAIRLKGFSTLVPDDALCASACALAWLGGKTKWAGPEARIAFHAAWKLENGRKVETGPGNALVGAYLQSLGLSQDAIVFFTSAPPDGAEMLSFRKAEALGLHVKKFEPSPDTQVATRQEPPQAPAIRDPDASYYDPNARTLYPEPGGPVPPTETKTVALPPAQRPAYAVRRPEEPVLEPQVLDLANLEAAAQVQRRLQERGFFQGLIDGVWGQRSRVALRDFKTRNGLGSDDRWDMKTQLAVFDDRYTAAPSTYVANLTDANVAGLYVPFAAREGASLHPLNPGDALAIQQRLAQLSYYRKVGDGVWGMASRSALTDFKVANGLPANDTWDRTVEEAIKGVSAIPATDTPFGEWVQQGTTCGDPNNQRRLVISSKDVIAGDSTCQVDPPLQRSRDGWRTDGTCLRAGTAVAVRVHFQLVDGRLVDRSIVGSVATEKPPVFRRCM